MGRNVYPIRYHYSGQLLFLIKDVLMQSFRSCLQVAPTEHNSSVTPTFLPTGSPSGACHYVGFESWLEEFKHAERTR